jgi:hypothetical protein
VVLTEKHANIAADTVLSTRTDELRAELKAKGKTYCEAVGYIAWLVADENNQRNGVTRQPYRPDKSFLQHCSESETWEKHR